jgi:hypothetical protein
MYVASPANVGRYKLEKLASLSIPGLINITITCECINHRSQPWQDKVLIWAIYLAEQRQHSDKVDQALGLAHVGSNGDQTLPQQQEEGGWVLSGLIMEA